MASGKVRWDVEILRGSIDTLSTEKGNLTVQRNQMKTEQNRADTSWKSPAGQQYQNRLQNDIATIDNIIKLLENRLDSLKSVYGRYSLCEAQIQTALKRLPY